MYIYYSINNCSYQDTLIIANSGLRLAIIETLNDNSVGSKEVESLLNKCRDEAQFLVPALEMFIKKESIAPHWRTLLRDLAKKSPASGFAQCKSEQLSELMRQIDDIVVPDVLMYLGKLSPGMLKFVCCSSKEDRECLQPITIRICQVLDTIETAAAHNLPSLTPYDDSTTGYFPGLPVIRERGEYVSDKKKESTPCRKLAAGHKSLLPGIFLIHCPHGMYSIHAIGVFIHLTFVICYGKSLHNFLEKHHVKTYRYTHARF